MRRGIEKLAYLIAREPREMTLGQLADKYDETVQRIMDAADAHKMLRGVPTQIPPVDWDGYR